MAVDEVVADAGEVLIEGVLVEGFAFFVEVLGPESVEGVHVVHGEGGEAGVVDVYGYLGISPDPGCEFPASISRKNMEERSKIILFNEYDRSNL